MLNPEFAQAQLKEIKDLKWQAKRLKEIEKLPEKLRSIGYCLFNRNVTGKLFAETTEAYTQQAEILKGLDPLTATERVKIFTAIFPQIATEVEGGWQLWKTMTYQAGYTRKSFRLPNNPELSFDRRLSWLQGLIVTIDGYDRDLAWFADWAAYLGYGVETSLGTLFVAAIDRGDSLGQEVLQILIDSAKGDREIGSMGRHVVRALLVANNPVGWEFIEKMLLAAQRQEGLRQSILEVIDEAHPIAYQRMLKLIIDENLIRFSATIRAVDVWFGFALEALNEKQAKQIIIQVSELLADENTRIAALASADPQTVYLALWSIGFTDAMVAIEHTKALISHPQETHRYIAVYFLQQLGLYEPRLPILLSAITDPSLHVATVAIQAINIGTYSSPATVNTFDRLQAILPNFPAKTKVLPKLVWEWEKIETAQEVVASAMMSFLGDRSPRVMMPYLSLLNPYSRMDLVMMIAGIERYADDVKIKLASANGDADTRSMLLTMLGDPSTYVREEILRILQKCQILAGEGERLEPLLTRKASELRRGILGLLLNQSDLESIASARRLLAGKDLQRQAGLELLRELVQKNRSALECQAVAEVYRSSQKKLTATDTQLLDVILAAEQTEATLNNALGLVDRALLSPVVKPELMGDVTIQTPASINCLIAIDELVHEHRQTPVMLTNWRNEQEEALLGNISWQFPSVDYNLTKAENLARLPLADVWENWWQHRAESLKDVDGLELIRSTCPHFGNPATIVQPEVDPADEEEAATPIELEDPAALKMSSQLLSLTGETNGTLQYPSQVETIVSWLLYLHPPQDVRKFTIDAIAAILQIVPPLPKPFAYDRYINNSQNSIRHNVHDFIDSWIAFYRGLPDEQSETQADLALRWWQILAWIDRSHLYSWHPQTSFMDVLNALEIDRVTEADLLYFLLGAESPPIDPNAPSTEMVEPRNNFTELGELTRRRMNEVYAKLPILTELADRCRQRILEVELQRGELPTAASRAALALRSITGIPIVIKLLQALDRGNLKRGSNWGDLSKSAVISHLMRISFPATADTPAEFAQQVKAAEIPSDRLIQFAFFAPQWVQYIEHSIQWAGFTDGVWWIHAHTKDSQWSVEQDVRETWVAQIAERTPLSAESLVDGAVDVTWFNQIHHTLGAERWQQLDEAAKYAASGIGHQRAKQFASAMLGELDRQELIDRIVTKRHQDSVRALGLLPLAEGKKREGDILDRYQILQEFVRTSKKFGSQRQASEKLAVSIGMENLARTAGYTDPQRLEWAMESQAIADLVGKAQVVTVGEVAVSLSIDPQGVPAISIVKAGKALKAIPANLKKDPEIQALTERKQSIGKQASRMRISLEQSMCRGDKFTASELVQLASHPVMAPMLDRLIMIGEGEMGYLIEAGTALHSYTGESKAIASAALRIAHPHDLLESKTWAQWQQDCFDRSRTQPFKQIFRELYVPTAAERKEKISKRYEGHQINPSQSRALFGQRGWISTEYDGVRRTFHTEGLIAAVELTHGYSTPLEVEGLTLYGVRFYKRDEAKPLAITEIPPRLFSEVMRDLDLVVSVAHVGGVDPEASASTVEMRSTILRETIRLLKITNVQIQSSHVLITGHLGTYSVHLGSGVVHRQPGGSLCILPVSSQHRGRLFLPFVDDDPKTAEVMSKVLLLAKDKEIKDPTILEQILSK
jgi:Family of unknown function (DUF5724)/Domain of unknown function (DUF4132)